MSLDYAVLLVLLIASPFVGSFLGVVAMRACDGRSVVWGRSECDVCHHPLAAFDLVPVVSWLLLGRRCRHCGVKLGSFYPLIEIAALVPVLWSSAYMSDWLLALSAVFGWGLLGLSVVDGQCRRLPDAGTLGLLVVGLGASYYFDADEWLAHGIGAAAGFAVFAVIAALYRYARKRDGLGLGDAKLLAAIGAWVGWIGLPTVVFLSAVSALLFATVRRHDPLVRIPFGPFLALAGWIVWLYGPLVPIAMP